MVDSWAGCRLILVEEHSVVDSWSGCRSRVVVEH